MSTPASPRPTVQSARDQLDDLEALLQRMLELPVNQLDDAAGADDQPATTAAGEAPPGSARAEKDNALGQAGEAPAGLSRRDEAGPPGLHGAGAGPIGTVPPPSSADSPGSAAPSRAPVRKRPAILPRPALPPTPQQPQVKQTRTTLAGKTAQPSQARSDRPAADSRPRKTATTPPAPAPAAPVEAELPAPATGPIIKIVPAGTAPATSARREPPPSLPPVVRQPAPFPQAEAERPALPPPVQHPLPRREEHEPTWWRWPLGWINLGFDYFASRMGRPGTWLRHSRGRQALGWFGLALVGAALLLVILDWMGWTP